MGESNNINIRPKDDERSRREIDTLKDETPPAMISVKSWQEGGGGGRVVFFPLHNSSHGVKLGINYHNT